MRDILGMEGHNIIVQTDTVQKKKKLKTRFLIENQA